uniref:Cytochrome P450 87A3 n=1 Tax=Aegilops tauschii subsp. strangulata TaxID=200361 RepID=A0A453CFB3_AEGTS
MKILKELLNERKKATCWESVDFIDILIDDLKDKKTLMNEKIALDLLFLLLFAGFETTSSGITATLKFLTGDPKALQELTEEHNNIRKRRANPDSEITWEEYKSMKFTSHVTLSQKDQRSWLVLLAFISILLFTRIPMHSILGGGRFVTFVYFKGMFHVNSNKTTHMFLS